VDVKIHFSMLTVLADVLNVEISELLNGRKKTKEKRN
jgi:hypothetical protein